jgi:hypothetical protein
MLLGHYVMVAYLFNSVRIDREHGVPDLGRWTVPGP